MHPLRWSPGLAEASRFHTSDIGPRGLNTHSSSDGTDMGSRLDRFGMHEGGAGENLSFGYDTAMGIMVQLVVDDGVKSRGHRSNIFADHFMVCGLHSGPHRDHSSMVTLDYAGNFIYNKGSAK